MIWYEKLALVLVAIGDINWACRVEMGCS